MRSGCVAIFGRGDSGFLFENVYKMHIVFIADHLGDIPDGVIGGGKYIFSSDKAENFSKKHDKLLRYNCKYCIMQDRSV